MALQHADFPSGQTGLYGATESYLLNGIYAQADSVPLSEDPDPNLTGNVLEVGGVGAAPGTLRRVLYTPHSPAGIARTRVVQGTCLSVRLDFGGRRLIQK